MSLFRWFSPKPSAKPIRRKPLGFDTLEARTTPSANTISGFVYQDADNDGIFDSGEIPIANVGVTLKNANGVTVATATTNGQGFYEFIYDQTKSTTPTTLTKTVEFPETDTNFSLQGLVDKFDSSLGQLQAVEILHDGSITSTIRVENTSNSSGSEINANVGGKLMLTAPGVSDTLNINQNVGVFSASKSDGNVDFGGASGNNFGAKTATGSNKITLTSASDLAAWTGTGKVSVQETAIATSSATGGGNVATAITSTGRSKITVVYKYIPDNCLTPGNYSIHETQPNGLLDGKDALAGVPIPGSQGTDVINVTLGTQNLVNNNFGELAPAGLSGYVYHDANNNGIKEVGEEPISGVLVTLSGAANNTATTDALGFYKFENLAPGSYTVTESQPSQYLDGKDTAGSLGGVVSNDQIANINLPGGQSVNNNFGELKPASVSGYVYVDRNNNGIKEPGEESISGVTITLTGFTADGPVSLTDTTDGLGFYSFDNLKPGTYAIQEGNPGSQYLDGKDTVGTQGGNTANDNFSAVVLASGQNGLNNNFGELLPARLSGTVYFDEDKDGTMDAAEIGIASVTLTLSGSDDRGAVSRTTTTDGQGDWAFENLRPGTYTVTETQPTAYKDGQETLGTKGGTVGADVFSAIALAMSDSGENYLFGEILADEADVGIVKSTNVIQSSPGDILTYQLLVTNYGTFTAKELVVTDTLPTGAEYVSASGAGWSITQAGGVVTAMLPQLAVGANSTITVQIKVPAINELINVAEVTAKTPDNNPLNNRSTVVTPVVIPPSKIVQLATTAPTGGGNVSKNNYMSDSQSTGVSGNVADATFVDGLFQTLLGRPVELAAQKAFMAQLKAGRSRAEVAADVYNSDEYRGIQANALYSQALGRAPSASERAQTVASLKAGTTEQQVAATLYASSEFQAKFANSASRTGALYVGITGALPSLAQSQAGSNVPLTTFIQNLQNSDTANRNLVNTLYRAVLRRNATEAELASFSASLTAKQITQAGLVQFLLASADFYQLALQSRVK